MGNYHFGEVSPLAGFSEENIEECEQNLIELIALNILIDTIENLKQNLRSLVKYPSLLFGLEQLLLSAHLIEELIYEADKKSIKLNGLVGIKNSDSTINEIKQLRKCCC